MMTRKQRNSKLFKPTAASAGKAPLSRPFFSLFSCFLGMVFLTGSEDPPMERSIFAGSKIKEY